MFKGRINAAGGSGRFYKKNPETGERQYVRPRSCIHETIESAFLPVEIHPPNPKTFGETPGTKEKLDDLFQSKPFMTTGIPMGFSLAKGCLTDLGARCLIEALLNAIVRKRFPHGFVSGPRDPLQPNKAGRKILTGFTDFDSLVRAYEKLREENYEDAQCAKEILRRSGIPVDTSTDLCRLCPHTLLSALNGDDNIVVTTLRVAEDFQRMLKKRGQGVETTKTAQSARFVGYCQSFGRSPIACIPEILEMIVTDPDFVEEKFGPKWRYDAGVNPHVTFDSNRPRLFTQAFKGGDQSKTGQTGDSARAKSISENLVHCTNSERLTAQLVFQEAFPMHKVGIESWLPECLGGLDYPHFIKFGELCEGIGGEFVNVMKHSVGSDIDSARRAKVNLRRQRGVTERNDTKSNQKNSAIEFILDINMGLPEDKQIKVYDFLEAKQVSEELLESNTCKTVDSSFSSSMQATSDSFVQSCPDSIMSRPVKTKLHKSFIAVESFVRNFETGDVLHKLMSGQEIEEKKPRPHADARQTRKRVELLNAELGEASNSGNFPKNAIEIARGMTSDRLETFWVRRNDVKHLTMDAAFSLKLLPGTLMGTTDKRDFSYKGKKTVYRLAESGTRLTKWTRDPRNRNGAKFYPNVNELNIEESGDRADVIASLAERRVTNDTEFDGKDSDDEEEILITNQCNLNDTDITIKEDKLGPLILLPGEENRYSTIEHLLPNVPARPQLSSLGRWADLYDNDDEYLRC